MIPKQKFIYIRHGEAEGNLRKLCQGWIDFPLTDLGRAQALDAASTLAAHCCGRLRLFTSSLQRARETAEIIAKRLCCAEAEINPALIERGWGVLDGADNRAMFAHERRELEPDFQEPSGIEGLEERSVFHARIKQALNDILSRPAEKGGNIVLVGHGRFFRSLCLLLHADQNALEYAVQLPHATPVLFIPGEIGWEIRALEVSKANELLV